MAFRPAKPIIAALLALSAPAYAQTIDLFEDQDEMKPTAVKVESADGSGPVIDSGVTQSGAYTGSSGGGFTLSFERTGSTILVPAKVDGREVYFVFDTGASFISLAADFARSAGLVPPADAPALALSTANGMIRAPLGIIRSLGLGGRNHDGVTYGLCTGCPTGLYNGKPVVGLLGMNVIGRYRTSFDHGKGVIEMTPSDSYADRWRDIEPWLEFQIKSVPKQTEKGWAFRLAVKNRSPRTIQSMTLEFWCVDGTRDRATKKVQPNKSQEFGVTLRDGECLEGVRHEVVNARW